MKSTLTTTNYDSILKETSNWMSTNDLHKKIGTDKAAMIESCKKLLAMGYLKTIQSKINYFIEKRIKHKVNLILHSNGCL